MAACSSSLAGCISGEWNAPPTFSGNARLAPAAFSSSQASSMPSFEPEMTSWPGQLKLAATQTFPSLETVAQTSSTFSSGRPMMAAIVPGFFSQAFCMALARAATSFSPSSKLSAPAATSAENSPREWPATMSGLNASPKQRAEMTLWRNTAGCVTLVSFSCSSVPANMMPVILKPRISSALSKSSFASGLFS